MLNNAENYKYNTLKSMLSNIDIDDIKLIFLVLDDKLNLNADVKSKLYQKELKNTLNRLQKIN